MPDFSRTPRVNRTEGWALSDQLIESPYISRFSNEPRTLCAEFRRMVFENGVPVRPSTAHLPAMIALTEEELRDTTIGSRANIMGVRGALRQAAFEKFPPLTNPERAPSHVIGPVEAAQVYVIYQQQPPRQMAAAMPSDERHLQMKG